LALFQNVIGIALVFLLLPLGIFGVAISRLGRVFTWPIRLWILHRVISLNVWLYLLEALRCFGAVAPALVLIGSLQFTAWASAPIPFWTFAAPLSVIGFSMYAALLWAIAGQENRALMFS
jgi:hypothetical protein